MATMNRHHHHHPIECITCSRHDLAEQWLIWCWTTITHCWKHSLAIISSFIVFYQFYFDLFDHKNFISKDVVLVIMFISHYDRSRGTNPLQIKSDYKFGMCCLSANHITLRIWILVFNATFNNISAISWRPVLVMERIIDHGQATGKLYHLRLWVECTLFVIYNAGDEPTPYWW